MTLLSAQEDDTRPAVRLFWCLEFGFVDDDKRPAYKLFLAITEDDA